MLVNGAITATNMAGRGGILSLAGRGFVNPGGLCVIGTERQQSRRIDNQLRVDVQVVAGPGEQRSTCH